MIATKVLLITHAVAAMALAGSAVHHAVLCTRSLLGQPVSARSRRVYSAVALWSMLVVVVLGMLVYPTFRVDVRAAWLDARMPLATGFFEIKEHWAALGLGTAATVYGLRHTPTRHPNGAELRLLDVLGLILGLVVVATTLIGLGLVSLAPV